MRSLLISMLGLGLSTIAQATIIPLGIQTNVTNATISGWGWTECSRTGAYQQVSTGAIVAGCTGDYLAMGIWDASLGAYGVVGIGEFDVVTAITYANYSGDDNGTLQNWSNGLNWYRTAGAGSWGFTTAAETALYSADINLQDGLQSSDYIGTNETTLAAGLSFHVYDGMLTAGWAYNATGNNFTNMDASDQRVFWTVAGPVPQSVQVPEPASLALLGLGLAGLTVSRWRKQ